MKTDPTNKGVLKSKKRIAFVLLPIGLLILLVTTYVFLPQLGATLMLHPFKRPLNSPPPEFCEEFMVDHQGVHVKGWRGKAMGSRRGTLIYLHGVADNRSSGAGVLERFRKRGFDVMAYDLRAHGQSGGLACSYGYYEKQDLSAVLDTLAPGPVVVIGSSLGGAVALQCAAIDKRLTAVVAAETFSDLRTVATERAPFFLTPTIIEKSFRLAEKEAAFQITQASPTVAAQVIKIPVFLIHGEADIDTPPSHSQRIFDALVGPKQLVLVPGAAHNQSLNGPIWGEIEEWIDRWIPPRFKGP